MQKAALYIIFLTVFSPLYSQAETLQEAWQEVVKVDFTLKAIKESTQASEYQLRAAKAARLPNVSLNAAYTMLENDPTAIANFQGLAFQLPMAEQESLQYRATTTMPIYTSGQISQGIKAATAQLEATKYTEKGTELSLKLSVAEAFVSVFRATKSLDVAMSHVDSLMAHERDVENLYGQGMVSRNDLLAAQVALADAKQRAIKVENIFDMSQSAYNRLLGRALNQPVQLEKIVIETVGESLPALTQRALQQRHELNVLSKQIDALNHQAKAIYAESGPQLGLSAGYAFQENQYQLYEDQWAVNLGVEWSIFDAGLVKNKARSTERQAAALKYHYHDLSGKIKLQVRQYWLAQEETRKRIQVTEKSVGQSKENLRVNRDRYENGLSTNTEVLDAEALRVQSEVNHANAIYDAVLVSLRLKWATSDL